jgi:hypothetical protein
MPEKRVKIMIGCRFLVDTACPVVALAKTEDCGKRPFLDGSQKKSSFSFIPFINREASIFWRKQESTDTLEIA